ncbi:MAG: TrmH family RNA methyltransferase, partial [Candidatus Thermoplasmatota archaeon]
KGKIGVVFGREDYGLYNHEIAKCDVMVRIPSSEEYPTLNLSHAVALVLYNLFVNRDFIPYEKKEMSVLEREKIYSFFSDLLDAIDYPAHRKGKTLIMFRRILGRAVLSKWEFHTLMGIISDCVKKIRGKK